MRLKKLVISMLMATLLCLSGAFTLAASAETVSTNVISTEQKAKLASVQVPFVPNQGQINDAQVKFYADTFAGTVFVTNSGITYALPKGEDGGWALQEEFTGGKTLLPAAASEPGAPVNYYLGDMQKNITSYDEITLGEVFDGINVNLKAYGNNVEKIFTVAPGADPGLIALKVSGADKLTVNEQGELELVTGLGTVKLTTPVAYQIIDGQRVAADIAYEVNGDSYGFKVGDYNHAYPLVIDPLLASTFLGGSGTEYIYSSIALDAGGNIFITGVTNSTNFPTVAGGFSQTRSGNDAYVAKLSADFSQLLAGTFFGGSSNDYGYAITVDGSGNAYITGYTNSANFPSTVTSNSGGYDMFAAKLDGAHLNRIAATSFGGTGADYAYSIALDNSGNVFIAGYSTSTINGLTGYQKTLSGSQDGIVVKFSDDLSQVLGSTYLGGSGNEQYSAVAVDQGGNAYVGGYTNSADYPTTTGALQTNNFKPGNNQGCVSELSSDLSQLEASTYLGGTSGTNTIVRAIALDNGGNIYVTGETADTNFPVTTGAFQPGLAGTNDGFVSKLKSDLSGPLQASTYIGGPNGSSYSKAITCSGGEVYIAGYTTSDSYPTTPGAYQLSLKSQDAFVTRLNSTLSAPLVASTYLGGSGTELGNAVAVREGNVYVAGYSNSTDYPVTSGVYQGTKPGGNDAFIAELTGDLLLHSGPADNEIPTWPGGSSLTESNVTQTSLTLTWTAATDNVGVTGYRIYKNNVLLGSANAATFTYNVTGLNGATYTFKVEAGDEYGNWSTTGPSVTVVTPDQTPPTFSSPVLTASNITGTSLTLTWYPALDNVGLTQFQILQNETVVASVYDGTATSYNITGLTPGAQYTFQVKAGDASGNWSSTNSTAVTTDNGAPTWPAGSYIRVSNLSDTGMTLNWNNATDDIGVTGYNIYKDGSLTGNVSSSTISYQVTGLSAGQTYTFKVEATDFAGNVSTSGPAISIKTTDSSHPSEPPALNLANNPVNQGRAAVFTFTPDAAWQAAISGITVDGAVYGSDKYSVSPGVFKIGAGVLPAGDHSIVIKANGYTDAAASVSVLPSPPVSMEPSVLAISGLSYGTTAVTNGVASSAQTAFDSAGNLYIAQVSYNRILEVPAASGKQWGQDMQAGNIYTVFGNGIGAFTEDGVPATSATIYFPSGLVIDSDGNIIIAEETNSFSDSSKIRVVPTHTGTYYGVSMTAGNLYTIAGTGTVGHSGDGGPATSAQMRIDKLALDSKGNILVSECYGSLHYVRMIPVVSGTYYGIPMTAGNIYTVAGAPGALNGSYSGDGGPATSAWLNGPRGIACDSMDNLYIADYGNNRVRRVDANGIITTVAGNGAQGYSGDNGPAASAQVCWPGTVLFDSADNLYIGTNDAHVRKVDGSGTITTLVSTANPVYGGGTIGDFRNNGLTFDKLGNLYVTDNSGNRMIYVQLNQAPSLAALTLSGSPSISYTGATGTFDLSSLILTGTDQYGNAYPVPTPVTWSTLPGGYATISGGTLTYNGSGTLPFTATAWKINSNTLNLTITRASGATLTGLAVTTQPFKLNYFVGETLNIKGLVVSGIFSDGTTQIEPVTAANVTGFNSSAPVNGQVLTITYEGQTTTFTVNILPAPAVPLTGAYLYNINTSSDGPSVIYSDSVPLTPAINLYFSNGMGGDANLQCISMQTAAGVSVPVNVAISGKKSLLVTPISPLAPGTAYRIIISADIQANNGTKAGVQQEVDFSTVPDTAPPAWPDGASLTASGVAANSLTLSWPAATDEVGLVTYAVYQDGTQIGTATGTTYDVTGLTANTTYNFSVKAGDTAGWSSSLDLQTTTTQAVDNTAPIWPAGSTLAISNITAAGLTLTWSAASDDNGVTSYAIYQNGTEISTVNGTTFTCDVTGMTSGTTYNFAVQAGDAAGNRSTDGPTASTAAIPTWPAGAAVTVSYSDPTHTSLTLSWPAAADVNGITGYRILDANGTVLATESGSTLTHIFTGLTAATSYIYNVEAGDAAGIWSADLMANAYTGGGTWFGGGQSTAPFEFLNAYLTTATPSSTSSDTGDNIAGSSSVPVNATIKLNFDKNVISNFSTNQPCFSLLDSSGATVPSNVFMINNDAEKNNIFISPTNPINPGSTYKILIKAGVKANNGSVTLNNVILSFSTEGSDKIKGDVNEDSTINVLDVVKTLNIVLEKIQPTSDERYAADVNDDDVVNVLDVVCIVNIILGVTN